MAQQRRSLNSRTSKVSLNSGPYLARIISHLDPSFMGSLEVALLRDSGNTLGEESQTFVVKCASPFFGYTAFEYMGQNSAGQQSSSIDAYNDTQKSYGMWMVPPDVGVTVLVVFVNGDPAQGYWIACIPPNFANNMVPGIAGSTAVDQSADTRQKYDTSSPLPVAEINRRINRENLDPKKIRKPVHPIADRFLEQGLLEDTIRGTTTSSARREVPSMVFGISTPGPIDRRPGAKRSITGTKNHFSNAYVSRLGGTQFVMDDGDERFQRKKPASEAPPEYADVLAGEKGDPSLPKDEFVRIRTRTGHQLLMHNTEDLMYIGNARGTAWVELTSNGKIDIYSQDSISIHTENDLNIRADRDINMEAGRNINMKAVEGRIRAEANTNFELLVQENCKITVINDLDISANNTKISSAGAFDLNTTGDNNFTSAANTNVKSVLQHIEEASQIHMNSSKDIAEAAKAAEIEPLPQHKIIATSSTAPWAKDRYQVPELSSILQRIPMHEPWSLHEHLNPQAVTPENTDREKGSE